MAGARIGDGVAAKSSGLAAVIAAANEGSGGPMGESETEGDGGRDLTDRTGLRKVTDFSDGRDELPACLSDARGKVRDSACRPSSAPTERDARGG